MKYQFCIKIFILILSVLTKLSVFSQTKSYTKSITEKDGKVTIIYYTDSIIVKKISTSEGLREGITEEYIADSTSGEYLRITSIYSKGILKEESFYSINNILLDNYKYSNGLIISSKKLVNIDENNDFHYIEKKYMGRNFMQYEMLNNIVIDSIQIKL